MSGHIGALGDRGRFVDDDDTPGLERAVISPGRGFRAALGLAEGGPLFGLTKASGREHVELGSIWAYFDIWTLEFKIQNGYVFPKKFWMMFRSISQNTGPKSRIFLGLRGTKQSLNTFFFKISL